MRITEDRLNEIYQEELDKAKRAGLPIPKIIPDTIETMKATSKFGDCRWSGIKDNEKQNIRIRISTYHLDNSEDDVRQTIAHEICHTCPGHGHDPEWRKWANILNRTYGYHISRLGTANAGCTLNAPERPRPRGHLVVCTACGKEYHRTRHSNLTLHPDNYSCGLCHGKLHLEY